MVFLVLLYMIINLFSCNKLPFHKIKILINVKSLFLCPFSFGTLKKLHYLCEVLKKYTYHESKKIVIPYVLIV